MPIASATRRSPRTSLPGCTVAAIGEPGIWQLRDQYLSLTGNKAPKEWAWDRLARELFSLYDRARLADAIRRGIAQAACELSADLTTPEGRQRADELCPLTESFVAAGIGAPASK